MRRLAFVAGGQLYAHVDKLLGPLEKECKRPIPKTEPQERALVMKRAALAAVQALNTIPNASGHAKLQEVITKAIVGGPFKAEWAELQTQAN